MNEIATRTPLDPVPHCSVSVCVCVCLPVSQLMKLNEDWDHIYRSTSAGLQQRVTALEQENTALKQLNNRLLLKVEHEQVLQYYTHLLYPLCSSSQPWWLVHKLGFSSKLASQKLRPYILFRPLRQLRSYISESDPMGF